MIFSKAQAQVIGEAVDAAIRSVCIEDPPKGPIMFALLIKDETTGEVRTIERGGSRCGPLPKTAPVDPVGAVHANT